MAINNVAVDSIKKLFYVYFSQIECQYFLHKIDEKFRLHPGLIGINCNIYNYISKNIAKLTCQ